MDIKKILICALILGVLTVTIMAMLYAVVVFEN